MATAINVLDASASTKLYILLCLISAPVLWVAMGFLVDKCEDAKFEFDTTYCSKKDRIGDSFRSYIFCKLVNGAANFRLKGLGEEGVIRAVGWLKIM